MSNRLSRSDSTVQNTAGRPASLLNLVPSHHASGPSSGTSSILPQQEPAARLRVQPAVLVDGPAAQVSRLDAATQALAAVRSHIVAVPDVSRIHLGLGFGIPDHEVRVQPRCNRAFSPIQAGEP